MKSNELRSYKDRWNVTTRRTSSLVTVLCAFWMLIGIPKAYADDVLISTGEVWRYLDNGSDQGIAWRANGFDDSAWSSGNTQLGYGDGDEATVVGFGPNPNDKFPTTYARHEFTVADPSAYLGLTISLIRDDGIVVYLNGTEVARDSMPAGAINYLTFASDIAAGSEESTFIDFFAAANLLVNGTNTLAVEIHQGNATSSDISFDLELTGNTTAAVTRGPYLQLGTSDSAVVRWRTNVPTDSRVQLGPEPGALTTMVDSASVTAEHEVYVSGLAAATSYVYSVGTTGDVLVGNDAEHVFETAPPIGTAAPTRIWVIGDSGTANANARAVRDAYLGFNPGGQADVWLMLGDNAYSSGTDAQYQAAVFDTYPSILRNSFLWPTLGNHDAEGVGVSQSNGTGPYFDMFTLPSDAQVGGLASGTEAYYSFDYGNIHFINLNSTGSDRSPGSPMLTWLEADLEATTQDWIIAYWHHPPYTKGSHDSDNPNDSGGRMFDMREYVLPLLEDGGVDLVLSGHSHSYERSFLIDGHYGVSSTFGATNVVDDGDGSDTGNGAYRKQPRGTVYAVAGSSGLASGGSLDHPAMFISLSELGSLVLDVNGGRLDATFVGVGGISDNFTLLKNAECDMETDQFLYQPGDSLEISRFRFGNPGPDPLAVELKVWLQVADFPPSGLLNIGADGSVVLPEGYLSDPPPFELLPDIGILPEGVHAIGCRLLDPVTGELLSEDIAPFELGPPL